MKQTFHLTPIDYLTLLAYGAIQFRERLHGRQTGRLKLTRNEWDRGKMTMAAAESNLDLAQRYMSRLGNGDLEAALSLCKDDLQFRGPDGTTLDKAGLRAVFASVAPLFVNPMEQEILSASSDGSYVAIEATSRTMLGNGREYHNIYAFIFEIEDGAISRCREYCDTTRFSAFAPQ